MGDIHEIIFNEGDAVVNLNSIIAEDLASQRAYDAALIQIINGAPPAKRVTAQQARVLLKALRSRTMERYGLDHWRVSLHHGG